MYKSIEDRLRRAHKIVFLTGAGLSQESGLDTFRGVGGLWKKFDPTKLATPEAFNRDPKTVWEWYYERRRKVLNVKPNVAHRAIADIENLTKTQVITQNIDGLHQSAGSKNIIELHGNIFGVQCTRCDFNGSMENRFPPMPPICEQCKGLLRPSVVLFGEPIMQWEQAVISACDCDAMIVVGTSLMVSPANHLPLYAKQNGALLLEINPEATHSTDLMDLSVRSTAVGALPDLLNIFRKPTSTL